MFLISVQDKDEPTLKSAWASTHTDCVSNKTKGEDTTCYLVQRILIPLLAICHSDQMLVQLDGFK